MAEAALLTYLKSIHSTYYGKVSELRDAISGWLAYIPHTFAHYTRHTVDHSDEIILQISRLLFEDGDPQHPVIRLSAAEAYILVAAAYLHDAGMVASDEEKQAILSSEEWRTWTSGDGGGTKRWNEIIELRQGSRPADDAAKHFMADIQTRFLLAEFVRRSHHLRAAKLITEHQTALGRFAFDNPMLLRTISAVCVAHGLRPHELEDTERYPDRRDIGGDTVNVRLLAILLRLGDLLDLSHDRACPLLLNAACPLPADSFAHWTQYQRIAHRLTATDKIELTAECMTLDEHRFLQDWCQWLVDETREARVLMARTSRHNSWEPPTVELSGADATIRIRPAPLADYIPSKWTLEIDSEAIFERLIHDLYTEYGAFLRELLQNAIDANRCQMYLDLEEGGLERPESPTQVDEDFRQRYPVQVSLFLRDVRNEMSGEMETRQVLAIEDSGIGMDDDIVQRYFLQVGRSYYSSDEFRRSFRFTPTSRFGLGFLSVFSVSDLVTVDTYKPGSRAKNNKLHFSLTGPRSYLLVQQGRRNRSGTRIEVLLRQSLDDGVLTQLVKHWCRRVEFPIIVDELGRHTVILRERPEQIPFELYVDDEGNKYALRSYPVNRPNIEGELYVHTKVNSRGEESWLVEQTALEHIQEQFRKNYPLSNLDMMTTSLVCLHGIFVEQVYVGNGEGFYRIDLRLNSKNINLARRIRQDSHISSEIDSRWREIIAQHLAASPTAQSEDGWRYKQLIASAYGGAAFWSTIPEMFPIYSNGQLRVVSLVELKAVPVIRTIEARASGFPEVELINDFTSSVEDGVAIVLYSDLLSVSEELMYVVFENRIVSDVVTKRGGTLVLDWTMQEESSEPAKWWGGDYMLHDLMDSRIIKSGYYGPNVILNSGHPYVLWLNRVKDASVLQENHTYDGVLDKVTNYMTHIHWSKYHSIEALNDIIYSWSNLNNLDPELYPPKIDLTLEMFGVYED